jgi:hypothetical protein
VFSKFPNFFSSSLIIGLHKSTKPSPDSKKVEQTLDKEDQNAAANNAVTAEDDVKESTEQDDDDKTLDNEGQDSSPDTIVETHYDFEDFKETNPESVTAEQDQ